MRIMVSAKKSVQKRICIVITVFLLFCAVSMAATKLVYDSIFKRCEEDIQVPPELTQMVAHRELLRYASGENLLTGYLYRCDGNNAQDGLVVLAPGFQSGADSYLWQIRSLLDYGWSVLAFDATGSFGSGGENQVGFAQALCDMEATLKYVEKQDRFGYNDIVLFGHSRGGYAACCALGYEYDIAAVVSVSGVNSAMEGVVGMAAGYVGPLAYGNYGFLWLYQAMLFGPETLNANADEEITNSDVPVLVIHGAKDEQVPADQYSIYSHSDEIESDSVEYWLCADGHTDLLFDADGTANSELMAKIHDFLIRNIA